MKNRNRIIPLAFIVIALIAAVFTHIRPATRVHASPTMEHTTTSTTSAQQEIAASAPLVYTHHARCRMDCRHISEADIQEVIHEGHINIEKSQPNESPCPTYAIEDDRNSDGVRLRIVFAKCVDEVKVVTCIDRDHDYPCDCK